MKRKDWWKLYPFATGINIRAADGKGRRRTDLSNDELRDLKYSATIARWLTENPPPKRPTPHEMERARKQLEEVPVDIVPIFTIKEMMAGW